jgi:hypothetical protein
VPASVKVTKFGDWSKAGSILSGIGVKIKDAYTKAAAQEAQHLRKKIVEGLRSGAPGGKQFKPLEASTLAARRFGTRSGGRGKSKPLIVSGDMRNAIQVTRFGTEKFFVGILRKAKGRDGKRITNVAESHEFGRKFAVPITDRSRRFLMAIFRRANILKPSSEGVTTIAIVVIPPRPFFQPVFDKEAKPDDVRDRMMKRIAFLLGGTLGTP